MTDDNRTISSYLTILVVIFTFVSFAAQGQAQTLYSCESPNGSPLLHTIDPNTGATISTIPISLQGQELRGCNGLAKDPSTGTCWIILTPPGAGGDGTGGNADRLLATINQDTGISTLVGNTGERIAGIAFNTNGDTLYGITGDGDDAFIPKIVTLSKINGSSTFVQNLDNDDDPGEAIGFNPNNGFLYRMSGDGPVLDVDWIFESINPTNMNVTQIPLSGDIAQFDEQLAFVHQSGSVFLSSQRKSNLIPTALHSITTNGVISFIGEMDHQSKGLAFDCGVPSLAATKIPTISEWGLIAMAGIFGIVGFMVMRRRRFAA